MTKKKTTSKRSVSSRKATGAQKLQKVTFTADDGDAPHELIAQEAYYIWERRGGDHGRHEEDWLEAERVVRERLGI